jgi:hypothetical protein
LAEKSWLKVLFAATERLIDSVDKLIKRTWLSLRPILKVQINHLMSLNWSGFGPDEAWRWSNLERARPLLSFARHPKQYMDCICL